MTSGRSPEEELEAAALGDAAAFEAFYGRYAEAVVRYFAVRTGDAETAADLMAETFAAALLAVPRYTRGRDDSAVAWLFTIARSKLIDSVRRGQVARRAGERLGLEPLALTDEDLQRVEELLDAERRAPRVAELLADLPVEQREALIARVVDERDYPSIAADAATSEAVVRKRVSRALGALRQRLTGGSA
jgi:RNA polymerase sigma factor (sigma-70 family)